MAHGETKIDELPTVQVLGFNGVSHLVVDDDLQAAQATLRWLSYLPIHVGDPTHCLPCPDPVDRAIEYSPPEGGQIAMSTVETYSNAAQASRLLHLHELRICCSTLLVRAQMGLAQL